MDNQQVSGGYSVDICMLIDKTGSMGPIINEVKNNALSFYPKFVDAMQEHDKDVTSLRVKVIAFGDYKCDAEPMVESQFFTLPEENDKLKAFVDGIKAAGGGDIPENALEALALALKSDWVETPGKKRQAIMIFTDAPALALGDRSDCPSYPAGMPADLAELGSWWEGTNQGFAGSYSPSAGRLIAFVPNAEPWSDLQAWNRYWPVFSPAGTGLSDVDLAEAIDLMVASF